MTRSKAWQGIWCFLGLAAWLAAASLAGAGEPGALAAKVQARYREIHSLRADYQRLSRFKAAGGQSARVVKGKGKLTWARPLKLRLAQAEPRLELVVTTAQGVWWVRPDRRRADIYPLEQFTSGMRTLLDALGGLAGIEKDFILEKPDEEERKLGEGGPVMVLRPKQSRADLKRLVLWFEGGDLLLKGFRTVSLMGDVTEYRLTNLQANPPLRPDLFFYTPPSDFKVRDHRPQNTLKPSRPDR